MAWQVPRPCTPCVGLHAGRWTVQRFGPYVPSRRCQKRRLCAIRALRALLGRLKGYRGDRPLVAQRATTCRRRAQILKGQSGSGAVDFVVICKCTWPAGMAIHRRVYNLRTRVDAGGGVASFRECLLQRVTKTPSVSPSCSGACGAGHCCMASASRSVCGTHPRGSPDGIPAVLYRVMAV